MYSQSAQPLFDIGIPLMANIYGLGYAVFTFFMAIFLEAWIMRKRFELLRFCVALKYSFLLNLITTIIGLPLLYVGTTAGFQPVDEPGGFLLMFFGFTLMLAPMNGILMGLFKWYLLAFGATVIVEIFCFKLLFKPGSSWRQSIAYGFLANLASYAVMLLLPIAVWIVVLFIGGLIYALST